MPQHIIEGIGAPAFTPDSVGQHYISDTGDEYVSVGTASSADWILRIKTATITVEDEGAVIDAATAVVDFVGAGVAATQESPGNVTVTIAGGGGGGGSPHPATKSYLIDYSKTAATTGKADHVLESQDGGANWTRLEGGNSTSPGASGRLVYGTPTFFRESQGEGAALFEWADQELGGTANRQNIRGFFRLNVAGSRWSTIALNENHQVNSGYALKGIAYDNAFACPAWLGGGAYAVLCHESGTNNYIRSTFDSGASAWTQTVITGSLLTDLETVSWYVCEKGLWWAHGNLWAALQFDNGAGTQQVRVYKSADGGATWTTFYTSPTNTVWAGSSSPNFGRGQGVVVTPTWGFFLILGNNTTTQMQVYRFPDAVSAPTVTSFDGTKLSAFAGVSLPWPGGHGYTVEQAGAGDEVFFCSGTLAGTIQDSFVVFTDDGGTTWEEGTFSGSELNPQTQYGLEGYDGFAWVYEEQSGTPVTYMKNTDGGFAMPHDTLNNLGRPDASNSGFAAFLDPSEAATGSSFMGIVNNA